jgi:glycosyltransferase involved in cell wall biosynthesis
MNTPKIGIDARLLYYRKGGISEYTRQLILALAELDTTSDYAVLHNFRDQENYCPVPNFRRLNLFTPCHHRFERTALSVELSRHRLDVLHSPDFIPPRRGARRHIITVHDLHFLQYPQFQTAASLRYYRDQIRWAVQHADHIFAQTETTKREIIELLNVPPEKITVHLLGVNPSFRVLPKNEVQATLASYQLPVQYMLFVSTIEPRKNIPGLLRAYAQLRQSRPDVPMLVLGGQRGWFADQELALIPELNLTEHVRLIEDVPFDVLPALYNGAYLVVLPSFYEGFGMPAIEAMACGTPVVVTERGALPEVVGEHGIYINPDLPESIADGITQLLDDATLVEKLRVGGLQHAAKFSWRRAAEIALQTYQHMAEL